MAWFKHWRKSWKKVQSETRHFNFKTRLLLKNSVESIWRNKGQVVSLMTIVFLGSAIYSLLDATLKRVDNSYTIFERDSHQHDFVMKFEGTYKNNEAPDPAIASETYDNKGYYHGDKYNQEVVNAVAQKIAADHPEYAFAWTYKQSRLYADNTDSNNTVLQKAILYQNKPLQNQKYVVDQLYLVDGEAPSGKNIVINQAYAQSHDIHLGDKISTFGNPITSEKALTVVGIGGSADFITPIIDTSKPVPDQKNDLLIYGAPELFGYEIKDGYWNYKNDPSQPITDKEEQFQADSQASVEISINGRFLNDNLGESQKDAAITFINDTMSKYFSYTSSVTPQLVFGRGDQGYEYSLRDSFFTTVLSTYKLIITLLLIIVLVISAFLVGLITQKRIAHVRSQIGVLKALGYNDTSIIASFLIWPLIAAFFGTLVGYFVGISLQLPLLQMFFSFFTLPHLSFLVPGVTIVVAFFITFGFLAIITIATCLIFMKGRTINLLRPPLQPGVSRISYLINRVNARRSFMVRLKYSLLAKALGKVAIAFCALFVSTILVSIAITIPKSLVSMQSINSKSNNYNSIVRYNPPVYNSPFSFYRLGIDHERSDGQPWLKRMESSGSYGWYKFNPTDDNAYNWTTPEYFTPHSITALTQDFLNQTWKTMTGYWRKQVLPDVGAAAGRLGSTFVCSSSYPMPGFDWNKYFEYMGKLIKDSSYKDLPKEIQDLLIKKVIKEGKKEESHYFLDASRCVEGGARKQMPYFMQNQYDANPDLFSSFIGLTPFIPGEEELATSFRGQIAEVLKSDGQSIKHRFNQNEINSQKEIQNYGIWEDSKLVSLHDRSNNNLLQRLINDPIWQDFLKNDNRNPLSGSNQKQITVPVVVNESLAQYLDAGVGNYLIPQVKRKEMQYLKSNIAYKAPKIITDKDYSAFPTTVYDDADESKSSGWAIGIEKSEPPFGPTPGKWEPWKNSTELKISAFSQKIALKADDFRYGYNYYGGWITAINELYNPGVTGVAETLMHALTAANVVQIKNIFPDFKIKYKVIGIQNDYSLPRIFMLKPFADHILGYDQSFNLLKQLFSVLANKEGDNNPEALPTDGLNKFVANKKDYQYKAPVYNKYSKDLEDQNFYNGITSLLFPIFNTKFSKAKTPIDLQLIATTHQPYGDYTKPGLLGGSFNPFGRENEVLAPKDNKDKGNRYSVCDVDFAKAANDLDQDGEYATKCQPLGHINGYYPQANSKLNGNNDDKLPTQVYPGYTEGGVDSAFTIDGYEKTVDNTSRLINIILYIFIIVAILISIIMVAVTANIIIFENQRAFATLKTVGYKNKEILRVTMGIYVIPLIISLGLGFMVSWFILGNVYSRIAQASAWVIPLSFNIVLVVITYAIIVAAFLVSFIGCWQFLKSINAVQALKEEE